MNSLCQMVTLLMTRTVYAEVTVPRHVGARKFHALVNRVPGILVLDDLDDSVAGNAFPEIDRLDGGERQTLKHYLNDAARFVIVDDGKAVRVCRRYAIPHLNALLIPKLLYFSNRISLDQSKRRFLALCALGRYSARVMDWAKACEASQLDFFLADEKRN